MFSAGVLGAVAITPAAGVGAVVLVTPGSIGKNAKDWDFLRGYRWS